MNFNAYRPSHRNRFLLLKHEVLTREELLLFELLLDQMGFDFRNDKYKKVEVDLKEFAACFGYSAKNSVRTKIDKLTKLGILIPTNESHVYEVFNAERYIATSKKWNGKAAEFRELEQGQPFEQIIQNIAPNFQTTEHKVQPIEQKALVYPESSIPRTLSSSKVNSNINLNEEESPAGGRTWSKEEWEQERLNDPALPSWENKLLIDEALEEATPIEDLIKEELY